MGQRGRDVVRGILVGAIGASLAWLLFLVANGCGFVKHLPFDLSYASFAGFEAVEIGASKEDVLSRIGPADGSITARELSSYHRNRWGEDRPEDFSNLEVQGGEHLFWLSRSDLLLVFNVLSFDSGGTVVGKYTGYDTFFGMRRSENG